MVTALAAWQVAGRRFRVQVSLGEPSPITIDYPAEGSVFPPEFPAPTWLWRDASTHAAFWEIIITFSDGSPALRAESSGEGMRVGESDPRCVSATNKPPALTAEQAAAHTWIPDAATWSAIKKHSVDGPATLVII